MSVLRTLTVSGIAVALTLVAAACAGGSGAGSHSTRSDADRPTPLPVVVDYSPTLSDVGALLYLASHPDVDLLAVTLAGTGESRCDAAIPNTRGLLALAGDDDVPVACGSTEPYGPGQQWPSEWRDAADRLEPLQFGAASGGHDESAVELLARTAAASDGVVVVALGPLTNIAETLDAHPGFAGDVAMLYSMGGAIGVDGNAPNGAEWNYYVDPTAVDVVVRSDMPVTLVPLDATDHVPASVGLYERMGDAVQTPALSAVHRMWGAARPWQTGFFLWDELTAMLAVDESLASTGTMRISVVTSGADAGRTAASADGVEVLVAGRPNRGRVERGFVEVLAGPSASTPPTTP